MNEARQKILSEIKAASASTKADLTLHWQPIQYADKKGQFGEVLKSVGGSLIEISQEDEIQNYISERGLIGKKIISVFPGTSISLSKEEMYSVDLAIIRGGIAVAENGAIWVREKNMGNRVLPFSCELLWVIIHQNSIVHNMHEAYDQINTTEDGFGIFISGPSKTADIEQSLVIGAHGPVDYTVFMITG